MPPELKMQLISTFWNWAEREGLVTYLQVQEDHGTVLPTAFIADGSIILNITQEATNRLSFDLRSLHFQGRFSGRIMEVSVPAERISAIFIKDTAIGLVFPVTDSPRAFETSKLDQNTPRPHMTKLSKISKSYENDSPSPPEKKPPTSTSKLKKI